MKKVLVIVLVITMSLILSACDRSAPNIEGIDETIEIQCGAQFNIHDYLNETLKITDETDEGIVEYKLTDLEYSITCDETIYNEENGKIKTDDYGTFDVELIVKDESRNKAKLQFQLFLNPIEIEKGFYMYPDDMAQGEFNVQGFCEIRNTSEQFLKLNEIVMQFKDNEDIIVYETDMPEFAPEFLAPGNSCYVMDEFGGWDVALMHEDDIAEVIVNVDYSRDKTENDTTLEVGEMETTNSYDSNESGFAATTVVTNPYDKGVEQYSIIAGLYDTEGNLIGAMDSAGETTSLSANGKGRATVSWLSSSRAIPDKVAKICGKAYVVSFEGE